MKTNKSTATQNNNQREQNDHWEDDPAYGQVFVTGGVKWATTPTLGILKLDPGKPSVEKPTEENPQKPHRTQPTATEPVTKPTRVEIHAPPKTKQSFVTPGGRPKKELPERFIIGLAKQNKSCRQIVELLEKQKGIKVSHMTIARIIAGQKVLV